MDAGADSGTFVPDSGVDAGPGADAGADAGVDAGFDAGVDAGFAGLWLTLGSAQGGFDRAQHGLEPDGGLYVEAYFGGDPGCPTQSSPTPDRTLIIAGLHLVPDGGSLTQLDGVRVTLLDFTGALTSAPVERATSILATPREVTPGVRVSFTVEATFDTGTLRGTFSALHCASLDGP